MRRETLSILPPEIEHLLRDLPAAERSDVDDVRRWAQAIWRSRNTWDVRRRNSLAQLKKGLFR